MIFLTDIKISKYDFLSRAHSTIYMGVAALIIVIQHIGGSFGTRIFTPLGGTGVAMFLIASGYGLNESYKNQKQKLLNNRQWGGGYWKHRLFRVFLPYALFEIILIPYYGDFESIGLLLDITCLQPRYWYFGILLINYLTFWFCIINEKSYRVRYLILGMCAVAIFFLGNALYAEQAASFMLGVLISDHYDKSKKMVDCSWILVVIAFVAVAMLAVKQLPLVRTIEDTYLWYLIQMIMKLSMAVFLIILTYRLQKLFQNRFIVWCGTVSMELYLIHYRMLRLFEISMPVIYNIVLFIGCSLFGTWVLNLCVKQLTRLEKKVLKNSKL